MLAARTGLHFPKERWDDLEKGIAAAAPMFGMPDAPSCARWLLEGPLTRHQIEVLAAHLTVGETYFFRDERCFELLEQQVLPERQRARANATRPLRIWSAGCCTGEEAYSIAMLLDRLALHGADCSGATILATDINPAFLRKAAQGIYGEWSFRATPAWLRERYFDAAKNSRFEIKQALRHRVAFSYLNLADDIYPSLTNNTNAMDVIFCRNVLMYFTVAQAKKVIENLRRSLVEGGWLIVSPAETSTRLFPRFAAVEFAGAVLYRKLADTPSPAALSPQPLAADAAPAVVWRAASPNPDRAEPPSGEAVVYEDSAGAAPLRTARVCANQGKLAEAAQWCEKAIAADRLDPAGQYLLATIRLELGQSGAAAEALLRALYLDPDFVLAHFALGSLCLSQGRHREAQRHFDNALALLRVHPYDEPLPESEGLTAGRLAEIIASLRSSLPRTTTEAQQA